MSAIKNSNKNSNKIVQKGYGLPLVFDIANRRYTYRADDDPRFLNLDSIATAKSAWVLRFKNKIDGLPQAYIVFSQTERPLDPIEYLADIDELYGIPDDELIKVAARSYIVDGYGEAHDTFCDRYMCRLEDMGQDLGVFAAIPARFLKIIPNNTFTYQTIENIDD